MPNIYAKGTRSLLIPDKNRVRPVNPILPVAILLVAAACDNEQPAEPVTDSEPTSFLPAPDTGKSDCGESGSFAASFVGAIEGEIRWQHDQFQCLSMPRSDDGVRLQFSGTIGKEQLSIIIALPGYKSGESYLEIPSKITLSVEGSGRFFSTSDRDACFAAINTVDETNVTGSIYCVSPLAEVNAARAVTITKLEFSSAINGDDL